MKQILTNILTNILTRDILTTGEQAEDVIDPAPASLDPPVSSGIASDTTYAFGFDRLLEGYTGSTVNLRRLSPDATANFGFTSNGVFDLAAVDTWRAGSDVDVVHFIDQKASGLTLDAVGTVAFIRSDVPYRLGVDRGAGGQLTRSATDGGVAAFLGDSNAGCLRLASSTIKPSLGNVEFHFLYSTEERKIGTIGTDPLGGNTDQEYVFSYGSGTANNFKYRLCSNTAGIATIDTTNALQVTELQHGSVIYKARAQQIESFILTSGSVFSCIGRGFKLFQDSYNAQTITDIGNGLLDDKALLFGGQFSGASSTTAHSTIRLHGCFGAIIVTKALTDLERTLLQMKLNQVGQQHRMATEAELDALFDEYLVMTDASAGVVAGRKGKVSLTFGKPGGSPSYSYNAAIVDYGIAGIEAGDTANFHNAFIANNNYFTDATEGTVVALAMLDPDSFAVATTKIFAVGDDSDGDGFPYVQGRPDNVSLAFGWEHTSASLEVQVASDLDDDAVTGARRYLNGDFVGDAGSNGNPHTTVKYNGRVAGRELVYGVTDNNWSVTLNQAEFENEPGNNLTGVDAGGFDGNIVPQTAENAIDFPYKDGMPLLLIGTFENPAGYHFGDAYATRKPFLLSATISLLQSVGGILPLGHNDADIAINPFACPYHPSAASKIMSANNGEAFTGTHVFLGFAKAVLTQAEMETIQVNLYKLLQ